MALFELRTLGKLDLRASDGRVLHSLLAQPKRLALLSYLCAATPRGMQRRDVLLAMFWPESDSEHGRTSLRNALHVLRRTLGEPAVLTRGDDEVGIAPDGVWCDAVAFEEAIAAGRLEDATTLYRGDLLAGFFIQEAPEFEQWLERERARLRQLAAHTSGELAEQRAAARDLAGAVSAARRAVELAGSDERALRRLLELLARSGDRAGALEAFDAFARRLAADYQAKPAEATCVLVERIRTGALIDVEARAPNGYVTDTSDDRRSSPQPLATGAPRQRSNAFRWITTSPARAFLLGLLTVGAVGVSTAMLLNTRERSRYSHDAVPVERRVAVLPLRNLSAAKEDEFLADGLHDAVITQLGRIADLHVISRQSVRAYRDKSVRQLGDSLGVGTIVDGSVQHVGDTVRVTIQVIDARKDRHLWADQYERAATAIFSLQNDVALAVAESLHARITRTERAALAQPPTRNAAAYTFYLKGRDYQLRLSGPARFGHPSGREDLFAAEELFERAIAADPNFALAHAALGAVHMEIYFLHYDRSPTRREQILSEAQAALRLQPRLPEGHLAMGYYYYAGHQDYAGALPWFEIASQGLPSDATVRMFIANVYRRQGRWEEARAGHDRAFQLAPRESDKALNLARTYHAMRRYADAVRTLDYAIAIEPTHYGFVLERGGLFVQSQGALDSLEASLERIPSNVDLNGQTVVARMDLALLRRQPREALAVLATARAELLEPDDALRASDLRFKRAQAREMLRDSATARLDYDTARVILERAIESVERAGGNPYHHYADLGLTYAALGRKQEAINATVRARTLFPESKDAWEGVSMLDHTASVFARVGESDSAFALIERLLEVHAGFLTKHDLRLNPRWDPLRRDPRFEQLVR